MNPYLSEKARGEIPRVLKWLRNAGLAFCVFCSVGGLYGIRAPWKIYCIRSAYYIYKSYGASLYREMLSVLVDAWGGDSDSFLSGILHGMARFLALYQGEYSRERLILRLRTVHPKTITRLAQNDTGNVADRHMKQILSIYNGAGRAHSLPCKR